MKKHLFIFTIAGLFFSCQREEADAPFATDTNISVLPSTETKASNDGLLGWVALTGQTHISAEEAQETALATAMQMREVEGIVTKAPLKIGSIEVVKDNTRKPYVPTKGNAKPEQADVYIVNFANKQGYVITSGDRRVPGVLAYNSYGHLGDTISNPGQAILFSYMQEYIEEQRAAFEANKEKLAIQAEEAIFKQLSKEQQAKLIAEGYFDENGKRIKSKGGIKGRLCLSAEIGNTDIQEEIKVTYGDWKIDIVKAPLLKTLWAQSDRYNDKVTKYCDVDGDESPVGCVATAVGQLLAYHKKPAVFKGRTMHWDDMTKIDAGDMFSNIYSHSIWNNPTAKEDIQYLLAHLGDSDLLAMDYGCRADGGSSSNINKAFNTFKQLGYNNIRIEKYNIESYIMSELYNNRPIYIKGDYYTRKYKTGWWIFGTTHTESKGHAWVLDGYVSLSRDVTYYNKCVGKEAIVNTVKDYSALIHNNLGWGGYRDGSSIYHGTGWYRFGIFNTEGDKESSNTYKSNTPGNYQFNTAIIINIQ